MAGSSTTAAIKRAPTPIHLFGEDVVGAGEVDDEDAGMEPIDDDWIIDDTGGALANGPAGERMHNELVKEMGEL